MSAGSVPPSALRCLGRELRTPAILYDFTAIRSAVELARRAFSRIEPFSLAFSVKANRCPSVLRLLSNIGVAAAISSTVELDCAVRAGFREVFATAPAFSGEDLRRLHEMQIVPDLNSLSQLESHARHGCGPAIGLRVCLPAPERLLTQGFHGRGSRFGVNARDSMLRALLAKYRLKVISLHAHLGDLANAEQLPWVVRELLKLADLFGDVDRINLGGGWYPLFRDKKLLMSVGRRISAAVKAWKAERGRSLHMICEPGAFLVHEAGYLSVTVLAADYHVRRCMTVLTVDSSAWNLLPWAEPRVFAVSPRRRLRGRCCVVGNTCHESDILVDDQELQIPRCGDRLLMAGVGSYSSSNARALHGYPLPFEYAFDEGSANWSGDSHGGLLGRKDAPPPVHFGASPESKGGRS
ncbi:MAG: hypothetical protein ABSH28_17370 [Acidobacteriota bacterium]|jgi:diaminopimelate decarboxylase